MTDNQIISNTKLEIIKASDITPKEVRWLWYPYIPFGKVTLLQGDPGDGKSKLMLSLVALLSKGEPLPFADEDESGEPMTIIYQTTEDDADDTVVPRFNSAGGDGERLIFIKEDEKSLTFGDDRIREAVERCNAKLLILDPMSSYIGGECSLNNANETRAEFNHLIAVAKDTGCAIVIIAHMNKAKDTSPLYRTNGSIDIAGAARSILAVTRTANKQNPAERYLVQVKSNLAPMGSAILFEVADKGVNFLDELELSAEDAFSASAPRMGRPNDREEAATDFIRSLLSDGRRLASDCEAKLEAAGFKKSTYKKSKKKAGVRSVKDSFLWYWTLPEVEKPIENGQEVPGEDNIVSAVMHADEINKAMSEELGKPVYHYHLHIVAIPTVRKEILWSKRCKDEALRGTVKEVINQVSHSKKWKNTVPLLDENGQQLVSKYGKPMFRKSYSVLQDKLFEHMTEAGFTGFERGILGSTAENLSSLDYQIQKDKKRLAHIQERIEAEQVRYEPAHEVHKTMAEIEGMGQKTITGKIAVSKDDYQQLTALAKEGITSRSEIQDLKSSVSYYQRQYFNASSAVERLQERYDRLKEKCQPFLQALEHFPKLVEVFEEKVKELFSIKEAQERKEQEDRAAARKEQSKHRRGRNDWER